MGLNWGELIPYEFFEKDLGEFCQFVGEVAEVRYISSAILFIPLTFLSKSNNFCTFMKGKDKSKKRCHEGPI